MYVPYRDPYSKVNVRVLPRRLSSCFTKKFQRIMLTHTKNCNKEQTVQNHENYNYLQTSQDFICKACTGTMEFL